MASDMTGKVVRVTRADGWSIEGKCTTWKDYGHWGQHCEWAPKLHLSVTLATGRVVSYKTQDASSIVELANCGDG